MAQKTKTHFTNNGEPAIFTIPTYRPKEVAKTVERYSDNFRGFGYSIPIMVFDDGKGEESRKKALKSLEEAEIDYSGEVWYVGELEKRRFLSMLEKKTKIDPTLLQKIFRPSYGGNRNFTLVYTLGNLFVSSDDDMHPVSLFEPQKDWEKEKLQEENIFQKTADIKQVQTIF